MNCPICNHEDTKVIDSRASTDGLLIRRRRECLDCEYRFSTAEEAVLLDFQVSKSDGRREPYQREKLAGGLRKALEKRPVDAERFRSLVSAIERDIQKLKKDEISSREVGEIVVRHLRTFDSVAYIRFASVYRSFADLKNFHDELNRLAFEKE